MPTFDARRGMLKSWSAIARAQQLNFRYLPGRPERREQVGIPEDDAPAPKKGPQRAAGPHQRSMQLILVSQRSIVVAIHLLPEGLHIPVLCTGGGRKGDNQRQGKKC
jgi:hypothetical protein